MNALVLSGGGARGAFEAGVVTALNEDERFDLVCGTSIGALNGVAIASGESSKLRSMWHDLADRHILRLDPRLDVWKNFAMHARKFDVRRAVNHGRKLRFFNPTQLMGLFDWQPIREILRSYYAFERLQIPFVIGVTNLTQGNAASFHAFPGNEAAAFRFAQGEPNAYQMTESNFLDALCASAAVPGAFPPVTIDVPTHGSIDFVDGGIANNSPIRQAIDAGATRVTLVFMQHSALRYRNRRLRHLGDVVSACQDISDERILELDLKLARSVNAAVLEGAAPDKRFVEIRVIGPSVPLRLAALNFDDRAALDRLFTIGFEEGRAALAAR